MSKERVSEVRLARLDLAELALQGPGGNTRSHPEHDG